MFLLLLLSWNFNPLQGWNFKPIMGWNFKTLHCRSWRVKQTNQTKVLWTTSFSSNFFLVSTFTNNVGHIIYVYGFHSEIFFGKKCIKNCNFNPFCYPIKSVLLSRKQGCNLLNSYLLTVLLSIPFDKLPCLVKFL